MRLQNGTNNFRMKNKIFWSCFALSILAYLLTFASMTLSIYAAALIESIVLFALTWIALDKAQNKLGAPATSIVCTAIILGRLVLEVPVHVMDFGGTLAALGVLFICIITVLLAAVCFNVRRHSVIVLSLAVYALLNLCTLPMWTLSVASNFKHLFGSF